MTRWGIVIHTQSLLKELGKILDDAFMGEYDGDEDNPEDVDKFIDWMADGVADAAREAFYAVCGDLEDITELLDAMPEEEVNGG